MTENTDKILRARQRIEKSFASQSMMSTLGAELVHVELGFVSIRCPLLATTQQHHGFAHAGVGFSIGDTAAGYAALSQMQEGFDVLTAEMKTNLLAPAKGDYLLAEGHVVKQGRRLVVVRADVWAMHGNAKTHIAMMTGTMVPVSI